MTTTSLTGQCVSCEERKPTFLYHTGDLKKIELCVACYDAYLAREMTQYWKDHIQEEEKRSRRT